MDAIDPPSPSGSPGIDSDLPSAEVHDDSLVRWMLSLSPLERLRVLEGFVELACEAPGARAPEAD
ncbi:MAG TPA: hypothetical protein VHQ65_13580 [Thermoanaerobaculia bacterium]|nr:hypothetical protein [Thermoanaerobaculia bacterium]